MMTRMSAAEREEISERIASLYATLFDADFSADDVLLTPVEDDETEAEIVYEEIIEEYENDELVARTTHEYDDKIELGLDIAEWRTWPVERKLEVLLHEFAHLGHADYEHGPRFWERLSDLVLQLQEIGTVPPVWGTVDFERLKEVIVDSVSEENLEPDDTVRKRRRAVREQLGLR